MAEAWLARAPALAGVPAAALTRLGQAAVEAQYAAGDTVVQEGDAADALYVVVSGRAEITSARGNSAVPLGVLGPGELFGEIALLDGGARRRATVRAPALLLVLRIPAAAFHALLHAHPELEASFRGAADRMLLQSFIKLATPFDSLPPERVRWLAERVSRRQAAPGERIIEQGAAGDACYLVRRGTVEVVLQDEPGGEGRQLAVLAEGGLFGEAALVTDMPRNASVRALEPCELLVLTRADLLGAAEAGGVRNRLRDLVRWRDRPLCRPGIEEHARSTSDGTVITVLKDPQRGAYYQLSPEGRFVWRHLDGRTTLRELTMLHLREFGRFDPQVALDLVGDLARAGFATAPRLLGALDDQAAGPRHWVARLGRLVDLRWTFRGLDPAMARVHRLAGWVLARPVLALQAAIAAAGLVAFCWRAGLSGPALAALARWPVLPWVYAGVVASTLLHEWAHALVVKSYGREVRAAGIGLYYLAPMAFVDTSDMWLEPRSRRILVNVSGMAANLVVAGACALAALAVAGGEAQAVLWLVAAFNYVSVLTNLNPLLELDGYYVLSDALDRPNLRQESLGWLGRSWRAIRSRATVRERRVELLYGLAALVYAVALTVTTVVLYRQWVLERFAAVMPSWAAELAGVVLAALVVAILLAGVLQDMRGRART